MNYSLLQAVAALFDEGRYGDIASKISAHFALDPESSNRVEGFLTALREGRIEISSLLDVIKFDEADESLLRIRFSENRPMRFGNEINYLGTSVPENLATILIFVANRLIPKIGTTAVVTSVRNEGPWILEWVAHYKALGVGMIVVVYNDSDDGTAAILNRLSDCGEITVVRNEVASTVSPQRKAFNAALHLIPEIHAYEWVSFLDADEFLVSSGKLDISISDIINSILSCARRKKTEEVRTILLHWRWFASPLQYSWESGSTTDRFVYSAENEHVKSIVRTSDVWSMSRLHVPTLFRPGLAVDSSGGEVEVAELLKPPRYEVAQINHYFAKSFQEFALKKARGRGAVGLAGPTREFDNFLWGAHRLTKDIREFSKAAKKLDLLMADPELARLQRESEILSRRKIEQLEVEANLRQIHAELTKNVKDS